MQSIIIKIDDWIISVVEKFLHFLQSIWYQSQVFYHRIAIVLGLTLMVLHYVFNHRISWTLYSLAAAYLINIIFEILTNVESSINSENNTANHFKHLWRYKLARTSMLVMIIGMQVLQLYHIFTVPNSDHSPLFMIGLYSLILSDYILACNNLPKGKSFGFIDAIKNAFKKPVMEKV